MNVSLKSLLSCGEVVVTYHENVIVHAVICCGVFAVRNLSGHQGEKGECQTSKLVVDKSGTACEGQRQGTLGFIGNLTGCKVAFRVW